MTLNEIHKTIVDMGIPDDPKDKTFHVATMIMWSITHNTFKSGDIASGTGIHITDIAEAMNRLFLAGKHDHKNWFFESKENDPYLDLEFTLIAMTGAGEIVCFSPAENISPLPEEALIPNGKNPAAVVLGRLGGLKGGKARAEKLSPERRSEIARMAGKQRWKNVK